MYGFRTISTTSNPFYFYNYVSTIWVSCHGMNERILITMHVSFYTHTDVGMNVCVGPPSNSVCAYSQLLTEGGVLMLGHSTYAQDSKQNGHMQCLELCA